MKQQLVKRGFDFTREKKKWVMICAAFGFMGFGCYKVYNSPCIAQKRRRLYSFLGALMAITEAVSVSAETIGVVSKDLRQFIKSDTDQIPGSLKQLSKVTVSDEFSESLTRLVQSLTVGVMRGCRLESRSDGGENSGNSEFVDRVMDRLFSTAGSGFASVVVGSFARNLVVGLYKGIGHSNGGLDSVTSTNHLVSGRYLEGNDVPSPNCSANGQSLEGNKVPGWLDAFCVGKGREFVGDVIQRFVSSAVTIYLDKTMHINTFHEMFSGLTNPSHENKVKDMLVSVCNGAVETLVRTSHQVVTNSHRNVNSSSTLHQVSTTSDSNENSSSTSTLGFHQGQDTNGEELARQDALFPENSEGSCNEVKESGWIGQVSSTLAVPSNRKLVLDLTGRITFETVRSFLQFSMEKSHDAFERCFDFVYEKVIDGSLSVARYVTQTFSVIVIILLSLWLHILDVGWISLPS